MWHQIKIRYGQKSIKKKKKLPNQMEEREWGDSWAVLAWPFGGLVLSCLSPDPGTGHLPKSEWHLKTFGRRQPVG